MFDIEGGAFLGLWLAFGLAIFGWMVLFDRLRRYLNRR